MLLSTYGAYRLIMDALNVLELVNELRFWLLEGRFQIS